MKVFPIKNYSSIPEENKEKLNFKGKTEFYYGEKPYPMSYADFHSNSSVEMVLNNYHNEKTGKIYFADPMEPISNDLKRSVDYIVYDNEPLYPDVNNEIGKNYFESQRVNYRKDFENIRDYHYRREMAGWSDKAKAQYEQWQAAECIKIYDKAGDLRYQKETLEDQIAAANNRIADSKKSINFLKELISEKESELAALQNGLPGLEQEAKACKDYQGVIAKRDGLSNSIQKKLLSGTLNDITSTIENNKNQILNFKNLITKFKNDIIAKQQSIKNNNNLIEVNTKKIADIKAKLIPLFDELKHFYAKQGIRIR